MAETSEYAALVHACSDGVRAGQIGEHDAVRILTTSIRDLFTGELPGALPARVRATLSA